MDNEYLGKIIVEQGKRSIEINAPNSRLLEWSFSVGFGLAVGGTLGVIAVTSVIYLLMRLWG